MASTNHEKYQRLIDAAKELPPITTAVVHPCSATSLSGAVDAAKLGLIRPILVGPRAKIEAVAEQLELDLSGCQLVEAPHSHAAAAEAVQQVARGRAEALMKGSLHTDELLGQVLKRDTGLRTARRLSHGFVLDVPTYKEALIISDAAVNIAPTLEDKVDIVQNAIDLAQALRFPEIRVAILSAVETVNAKIPSTVEAAALCKMADRGQITGGVLDGPLALDNAINAGVGRHQANRLARRGARERAHRPQPGERQHAGEEPGPPGPGRRRRHRPRREGSDHPDQPRRLGDGPAGVVRGGAAGRPGAPEQRRQGDRVAPQE